ncbi:hypothetical protein K440DRAFT_657397 [Wilcoxina mikolae CBS 423.85]|nr:hypothetical protein K440DRAFT_657397 [Wilcoxina mikolae CBS 423.85]
MDHRERRRPEFLQNYHNQRPMETEKYSDQEIIDLDMFDQWQIYPENQSWHDPTTFDLEFYLDRLHRDAPRVLGDSTDADVLTVHYSSEGVLIRNSQIEGEGDLRSVIVANNANAPGHVFFNIAPIFSFGVLQITEELLCKLLTSHAVFPGFLDLVHLYGEKTDEVNEDFAVYRQYITRGLAQGENKVPTIEAFELCYNWRYVLKRKDHGSSGTIWTTRKMGMYAKYQPAKKSTTWIPIQASDDFHHRLNDVFESDKKRIRGRRHDLDIHLLLMQTASQNWTPYINDLEIEFRDMDRRAFMWRPKPGFSPIADEHKDSELELEDTQRIQRFKVKLLQIVHSLDINCANIASLRRGLKAFQQEKGAQYASDDQYQKTDRELNELLIQTTEHRTRVKNIILQVESLFSLVITIIPYIFARRENCIMLKLSDKATQYARSMKVITVVCMLYLPPSLMAAVFGMGLFFGNPHLAPAIGYFILATAVLMVLTWGAWMWWERRYRISSGDEEMAMAIK